MYLGYLGNRIKGEYAPDYKHDWYCSKFGGSTEKLEKELKIYGEKFKKHDVPICKLCFQKMVIVCQVHSPRSLCKTATPNTDLNYRMRHSVLSSNPVLPQGEDDYELRTLVLFSCNNETCCTKDNGSWAVYRFQPVDTYHLDSLEEESKLQQTDDFISGNELDESCECEKDCLSELNNGDQELACADNTVFKDSNSNFPNLLSESKPHDLIHDNTPEDNAESSCFKNNSLFFEIGKSFGESSHEDELQNNIIKKLLDIDLNFQSNSSVPKNLKKKKSVALSKPSGSLDCLGFLGFYMEFDKDFEELDTSFVSTSNEIASKYVLTEDNNSDWAGETYENSLSQNDKLVFKFFEVVDRSPEQCLRYWRGFQPVYYSTNDVKNIPNCDHCGAARVFEFQLMPALLSFLKTAQSKKTINLDYGTVIVYTCSNNCQSKEKFWFKEFSLPQVSF